MNAVGNTKVPTHIDMGAPGFDMFYVDTVSEYAESVHRDHEAGWTTYGLFENDAFVCIDCAIILIERIT